MKRFEPRPDVVPPASEPARRYDYCLCSRPLPSGRVYGRHGEDSCRICDRLIQHRYAVPVSGRQAERPPE